MDKICKYVSYGDIQSEIDRHYRQFGRKIDFLDAVKLLYSHSNLLSSDNEEVDFRQWDGHDPEELRNLYYKYRINVDDIINHPEIYSTRLPEDLSFTTKDIWPMFLLNNEAEHMHNCDFFEILYVMRGSCDLKFDTGSSARLDEGCLCIVTPGIRRNTNPVKDSIVLDIMIKSTTLENSLSLILKADTVLEAFFKNAIYGSDKNYISFDLPLNTMNSCLIRDIYAEGLSDMPYSNEVCNSLMNILLAEVLRCCNASYIHVSQDRSNSLQMPLVISYIKNNFQSVRLRDVASAFGYDADYMGKLIRKSTGMFFNDIVNIYKTEQAVNYLLYSDKSLSEIADLTGFNSVDHFSRTFKKLHNTTPGRFRKNGYQS